MQHNRARFIQYIFANTEYFLKEVDVENGLTISVTKCYAGLIMNNHPIAISKLLFGLSRPRFWLYEAGTFLLGVLAALQFTEVSMLPVLLWGFYFLIPANILIYGVNDVYDYETDLQNPKKQSYESVLPLERHRLVLVSALIGTVPFALYTLTFPVPTILAFIAFVFFAYFYSAPPIRAKARPFIDSFFSAGHYVSTGVFGFLLVAPFISLQISLIISAMAWAIAMHVYSAIPDITADRSVALDTTATFLGQKAAIWYCVALFTVAGALAAEATSNLSLLLLLPYLIMMFWSYNKDSEALLRLYVVFPYLNAATGAILSIQSIIRLL